MNRRVEEYPHGRENMVEVDYRCLRCGFMIKIDTMGETSTLQCKNCGYRIFMKPRRGGHKDLIAE